MFRIFIMITLLFFISGCSGKVPFTEQMRNNYNLSDEELSKIQFYLSNNISMSRKATSGSSNVKSGRLVVQQGKMVEIVEVPKMTPGIAVSVGYKRLDISFEEGTSFTFEANNSYNNNGRYVLDYRNLGSTKWDKNISNANIYFEGEYYSMKVSPKNMAQYLLIDRDSISNLVEKRRELKGRRVSD